MPFSSFEFFLCLPPCVALYYALWQPLPQRLLVMALTALFIVFPGLMHLAVFAAVVAAAAALVALANRAGRLRGVVLAAAAAGLAGSLAFFKLTPLHPLGISYYSFILIGFILEAHRGALVRARQVLPAIVFFPILLAGPIVRWRPWRAQFIRRRKRRAMRNVTIGSALFAIGAFKKILIADAIGVSTAPVWANPEDYTRLSVALCLFAFYLQVYADFSGYTDMARGVARMLGFHLPINFRAPYLAATPLEFWSRWHISLTSWIRDYVYTPLSFEAMRRVPARWTPAVTFVLVILLMIGVGLWHDASINFVVFGGLHGVLIGLWYAAIGTGRRLTARQRLASVVLFQVILMGSLMLFRADSLGGAGRLLAAIGSSDGATTLTDAAVGLGLATLAVFGFQLIELRAGIRAMGRRLVVWRGNVRLFPILVIATCAVFYLKGLTLEGVWISPADPYFNQGQEKFIYFEF